MNTKIIFIFIINVCFLLFSGQAKSQTIDKLPESMNGLWYGTDSTEYWALGIEKTFVAMENSFWDIDSIHQNKDKYTLFLRNGTINKKADLVQKGKSKILFSCGNNINKVYTNIIKNSIYKPLNTNTVRKTKNVVVQGYIPNFSPSSKRDIYNLNFSNLGDLSISNFAEMNRFISKDGRFKMIFNPKFSLKVQIGYLNKFYEVLVSPGDSVLIVLKLPKSEDKNSFKGEFEMMGDNWWENKDLANYSDFKKQNQLSENDTWKSITLFQPDVLRKMCADSVKKRQALFDQFIKKNPTTEKFKIYEQTNLDNITPGLLIEYSSGKMFKKEALPTDFLSIMKQSYLENKYSFLAPSLQKLYFYANIYLSRKKAMLSINDSFYSDTLSLFELSTQILEKADKLTDSTKHKINELIKTNFKNLTLSDSIFIRTLKEDQSELLNEYAIYKRTLSTIKLMDNEFNGYYYDLIFTSKFYLLLMDRHYQEIKYLVQLGLDKVGSEYVKNILTDELKAIKQVSDSKCNYATFVSTEHKTGEEILSELISTHKNKVIYIDFWATWCSPCMQEMIKSKPIKEVFKNQDVAFVYICIRSEKPDWKPVVAKMDINGIHYFLNKEQGNYFKQKFNFEEVPHYLLIDKSGKIVNENAERPSSETIVNTINSLLLN